MCLKKSSMSLDLTRSTELYIDCITLYKVILSVRSMPSCYSCKVWWWKLEYLNKSKPI